MRIARSSYHSLSFNRDCTIQWLLLLLSGITLYPLLRIGFVTGDDLEYFITASPSRWFADAQLYAQGTGRFYFYLVKWIYSIPYLVDSRIYYLFFFIGPIILTFCLFFSLIKRVTKSQTITYWSVLFANIFLVFFAKHSAITAYPLYFTLSLSLLFISFHYYYSYIESGRYKHIIYSALFLGMATLFYEVFLIYQLLFLVLLCFRFPPFLLNQKEKRKQFIKSWVPYLTVGILYLAVYAIFYFSQERGYDGNQISSAFSLAEMGRTLWRLSSNSLPLAPFFEYKKFFIDYALTESSGESYLTLIFKNIPAIAYVKGALVALVIYLIQGMETPRHRIKKLIQYFLIALLFIVLPHLLISISEKYILLKPKTYITTSFSFFAVLIALITLFLIVDQHIRNIKVEKSIKTIVFIFLIIGTLFAQFTNERVTDDMRVSQARFKLIDALFTKDLIPDGIPIYMEKLHDTGSHFCKRVTLQSAPFKGYIQRKNGVLIEQYKEYATFYELQKSNQGTVAICYFFQAPKTGDACLIIAFLSGENLHADFNQNRVDSIKVGYLSPYKQFSYSIQAERLDQIHHQGVICADKHSSHSDFQANINRNGTVLFQIKGEKINPASLLISNYTDHNLNK
ncbi:MAG TPA: hypothetical protein PLH70_03020 [Bacteroidales bacterium]|nr:hypothetical protein [Bacteroidales bacterium]HOH22478.1 hypothetical protein [Bacteroidales bacterium]HPB58053.1 hypothetical protein [Bacteroidales bacterium]HPZ03134.1 hypothetical protein [Bacteroidales bacterium]HQB74756.1 hypothetical protein [Bacteroidales bacterium]